MIQYKRLVSFFTAALLASATTSSPTADASISLAEELGVIEGTVISTKHIKIKGKTSQRDLVIYLERINDNDYPAPSKEVTVLQSRLNFKPHILAIQKGTKVNFKNVDRVKHNMFSKDSCCEMDHDMVSGEEKKRTFNEAGVGVVLCRLHPEMSLYVVVLENPFFQTVRLKRTKVDGKKIFKASYKLEGVPPGTYLLKTWNKKLKVVTQTVVVQAGKSTLCDLKLKK